MTGKIDLDTIKKITATMGPISIYQFGEFSKYGVNALRLFQYIKTIQGLQKLQNSKHEHWVKVGNVKPYTWFGLGSSKKWEAIKRLEKANLILVKRNGSGKAVKVKIKISKLN